MVSPLRATKRAKKPAPLAGVDLEATARWAACREGSAICSAACALLRHGDAILGAGHRVAVFGPDNYSITAVELNSVLAGRGFDNLKAMHVGSEPRVYGRGESLEASPSAEI
jgi:hypothetical protein